MARQILWLNRRVKAWPIRCASWRTRYATHEDMQVIRRYVSDDDFREALDKAPPGIVHGRSWAYWNSKMGRDPVPPLPQRTFGQLRESLRRLGHFHCKRSPCKTSPHSPEHSPHLYQSRRPTIR